MASPRTTYAAAFLVPLGLVCLLAVAASPTQMEPADTAMVQRIRSEAFDRSHVMEMEGYLTDVIGPRLTGSANLRRAQEYARDLLRSWGAERAVIEPWGPFGRGWQLERVSARMT